MIFRSLAEWRPLGPGNPPNKMARHDIICLHTMVGYLRSTDAMFHEDGYTGVESHYGVGGIWGSDADHDLDGVVYQWVNDDYRADANLDGNHRLISIETADNAPQHAADIRPWTPRQVESIIRLVADRCRRYDIPAELVPDSKPGRRGIAYHRQGIDPWRVSGGEIWSKSRGKECPGDARIAQLKTVIIPGVRLLLAGKPLVQEDDMAKGFDDKHKLTDADVRAYGDDDLKVGDVKSYDEIVRFPPAIARLRREQTAQLAALTAVVSRLAEAIKDGGSLTAEQAQAAAQAGAEAALDRLKDAL